MLVYCYIKDIPAFATLGATIARMAELSAQSAQVLADATGDRKHLLRRDDTLANSPMVDQLAFNIALALEEKLH